MMTDSREKYLELELGDKNHVVDTANWTESDCEGERDVEVGVTNTNQFHSLVAHWNKIALTKLFFFFF